MRKAIFLITGITLTFSIISTARNDSENIVVSQEDSLVVKSDLENQIDRLIAIWNVLIDVGSNDQSKQKNPIETLKELKPRNEVINLLVKKIELIRINYSEKALNQEKLVSILSMLNVLEAKEAIPISRQILEDRFFNDGINPPNRTLRAKATTCLALLGPDESIDIFDKMLNGPDKETDGLTIGFALIGLSRANDPNGLLLLEKYSQSNPTSEYPKILLEEVKRKKLGKLSSENASSLNNQTNPSVPQFIVYRFLFLHIGNLDQKAQQARAQGQDPMKFQVLYRNVASLSQSQADTLNRIALDCVRQMNEKDQEIKVLVDRVRAQYQRDKGTPNVRFPQPPPELKVLQDERDQIVLKAREQLRQAFGEMEFTRFDAFVQENFGSRITVQTPGR